MMFHVTMTVNLPHDLEQTSAEELKAKERERAADLQRQGQWRHLWRVAGRYANVSIFDVEDADQLHALLTSLPTSTSFWRPLSHPCRARRETPGSLK